MEVRRSKRRRRTVSAYRDGDRIVVLIPAALSRKEEAEWVETMIARLEKSEDAASRSDDDLMKRAGAQRPLPGRSGGPGVGALGGQPGGPLGLVHAG